MEAILAEPVTEQEKATYKDYKILRWLTTVDHKELGILYLCSALLYFVLGGIFVLLMRTQLSVAGLHFLSPNVYNQLFTMHGTTMIFFVAVPALIGYQVYVIPMMIGANEMAYPRMNAFSFWITFLGGVLLYFSFAAGGAPNAGWFNYAPLNEYNYSSTTGINYYCMGLLLGGIGTVSAGINIVVTVLRHRVKGMTLKLLPLFAWMSFINAFLIIAAIPALNAAMVMLLMDRQLNAHFFTTDSGGSALLWQHLFWLFGHPEVYILILPAFGIFSEIFQVFSRKRIYGYVFIAGSTVAIALLAFGVWVHHMFATGLGNTVNAFFSASSMLIGVPTGIKIFNWLATMYGGSIKLKVPMLFAIAFLIEFTIGGLSGIAFSLVPLDWQLTDSYYVVAHLHYVFVGGTLFGIFAGLFYWFPKMSGKMLDEKLGKWFFWLFVIGFNLTFFVQHILGLMGMPRRVYTYPDRPGYTTLNLLSTIGAFLMGAAVLLLFYTLRKALKSPTAAPHDPWDGYTLEWYSEALPGQKNFDEVPIIKGRRPYWDFKNPDKADWINDKEKA